MAHWLEPETGENLARAVRNDRGFLGAFGCENSTPRRE